MKEAYHRNQLLLGIEEILKINYDKLSWTYQLHRIFKKEEYN